MKKGLVKVKKGFWKSKENQKKFMSELYSKLNFKSLDDWLTVNKETIKINGGYSLVKIYKYNYKDLLSSIFPDYQWNFSNIKLQKNKYFQIFENQQKFIDNLFIQLNLNTLEDFLSVNKEKIKKYGGESLLKIYKKDLKKLYCKIYPNYPWNFQFLKLRKFYKWKSIDNQKKYIEKLAIKLGVKRAEEWAFVSCYQIRKNGGENLLKIYKYNMKNMIENIYLNNNNNNNNLNNGNDINNDNNNDNINNNVDNNDTNFNIEIYNENLLLREKRKLKLKLFRLQLKFLIKEKKDWYQISNGDHSLNLFQSLKLIFPNEEWKKKPFQNRSKKQSQRYLFIEISRIFQQFFIYQNYRPSFMLNLNYNSLLEFDIFIPNLNIAFEYQGQHHYDDIPSVNRLEVYQSRDHLKEILSSQNNILLIIVPYWWDRSIYSLISTLRSYFSSSPLLNKTFLF